MQYGKIKRTNRFIPLEPTDWGLSYRNLFNMAYPSGHEVLLLESSNNFDNPAAQSSQALYKLKGKWGEIFRDAVIDGDKGTNDKGKLHIRYFSHAGTEMEREHMIWVPRNGFPVPDYGAKIPIDMFYKGTLIPMHTVQEPEKAIKLWEKAGFDPNFIFEFYRWPEYQKEERTVARTFDNNRIFNIQIYIAKSNNKQKNVGTRHAFMEPEVVLSV